MKGLSTTIPTTFIALLSGIVLCTSLATAQEQLWVPVGGPIGGTIEVFDRTDSALLVGTPSSGIFRSIDHGATWQHVMEGIKPTFNVVGLATRGDTAYAATMQGGYRSTDNGATWNPIPEVMQSGIRAVTTVGEYALMGDDDVIYRIDSHGAVDLTALLDQRLGSLTAFAVSRNAIFAVTTSGLLRTTDGGFNWTRVLLDQDPINQWFRILKLLTFGDTLIASVHQRGIYRSVDMGEHWTLVLPEKYLYGLSPSGNALFAWYTGGPLMRSADFGESWHPTDGSALFGWMVKTSKAIIGSVSWFPDFGRSTDGGETWHNGRRGINTLSTTDLLHSGDALIASTIDGPYRMHYSTGAWERTAPSEMMTRQSQAVHRHNDYLFIATGNGVFRSSNNGATWVGASSGLGGLGEKWVDAFTTSEGALYVASSGLIFRSTNNGDEWMRVGDELTTVAIDGLSSIGGTILATNTGGLWRSTSRGSSWTQVTDGLAGMKILGTEAVGATFYALTSKGLHISTDDGLTWSEVSAALRNIRIVAFATRGDELYVGGTGGVYRSTDNGATWSEFNTGLYDPRVQSLAIANGTLYAATFGNGVFKVQLPPLGVPGEESMKSVSLAELLPNPSAGSTTLRYAIEHGGHVSITLFDPIGREVRTLLDGAREAGEHELTIDAAGLASGVYYCRLQHGGAIITRPLVIGR